MNTKTLLTVKTDKKLKTSAKEVAEEIGVPLSTVINAFLRQFIRDREVKFSASHNPSLYLRESIAEGEKELADGKIKFYKSYQEMRKSLDQ